MHQSSGVRLRPRLGGAAAVLLAALVLPGAGDAAVQRLTFAAAGVAMVVEVLDDDLLHFELLAASSAPADDRPIPTSPMVLRTDHGGPQVFVRRPGGFETADLSVEIDPANLCTRFRDKRASDAHLTTVCPADFGRSPKGVDVDPGAMRHVYGLGQQFLADRPPGLGPADGDWTALGVRSGIEPYGNGFAGFRGGMVGNVQIPVMYALGEGGLNYGLFLDSAYHQRWDFGASWWRVRVGGEPAEPVRYYLMAGPDLLDLRGDFLELTGRPPVPPRKAFGLWVSEFGYDGWEDIDVLRDGLRGAGFAVDGFVLDLNWFGGVVPGDPGRSAMGRLDWDQDQTPPLAANPYRFPDPAARIRRYADDHLGLMAIEESYVASTTDTFREMPADLTAYRRTDGACDPTRPQAPVDTVAGFWGVGRMIDWSDPAAGAWIHDRRRFPNLVANGVTAHWTDLGEPESFDGAACYEGVGAAGPGRRAEHRDVHNLYNLLWNRSIWDGYFARRGQADGLGIVNPRPFVLTRSGAAGTQRFGAAMWSGDIGSDLQALAAHLNAQMHMSLSGIDYYGADVGGFRREALPGNNREGAYRGYEAELFTQWLANGAWFDVPVRPHTDNEFVRVDPPYATAPHLVGDRASNLANLRQRYELIPYYYSLAYRAHLFGEPVVPPLVVHHQADPNARRVGHEKLVGRDLLVAAVAGHGQYERDVYLPAGRWVNYHTDEWVESRGEVLRDVPVYRDGVLRLPAFARAGAILPQMHVDAETRDAFGSRAPGAPARDELVVRVYADPAPSEFTLYEDDGRSLDYTAGGRPVYRYTTTRIAQRRRTDGTATVTVDPAIEVNGGFSGAPAARRTVVRLAVQDAEAAGVDLDGTPLPRHATRAAFDGAMSGWFNAGPNLVLAKSDVMDARGAARTFEFRLLPAAPTASVNFVCDRGHTQPGTGVYAVGDLPALGGWDPARAVRLSPSVYYAYVVDGKAAETGVGSRDPVWTGTVAGLPPDTTMRWKCIRRREDGGGTVEWEPGPDNVHATGASGYAGRTYGRF